MGKAVTGGWISVWCRIILGYGISVWYRIILGCLQVCSPLLRYTSRHTWPALLSLSAHRVTSDGLSPLQPHVPLPPVPPRPPRDQQGNLVLQPGDCCLLILQRLCIKWWGGGFVSVCQCVCARALSLVHACTGGCGRTLRTPTHADIHTAVHVHAGTRRRHPDSL